MKQNKAERWYQDEPDCIVEILSPPKKAPPDAVDTYRPVFMGDGERKARRLEIFTTYEAAVEAAYQAWGKERR